MTTSYIGILVAAVIGFIIGAAWYMGLSRHWLAEQQWSDEMRSRLMSGEDRSPLPFIVSFITLLVIAWAMSGIIGHVGNVSVRSGIVTGALCWFGFVLTTFATNYAYAKRSLKAFAIDAGHFLLVFAAQGAVLGWFMAR